jgi:hypothetical protein
VRKPKESPVNYVPCLQMRKDRPHYCPTCPQNFPKKLDFLIMFWEKLTKLLCSILTEASMATRKIKKSRPISRILSFLRTDHHPSRSVITYRFKQPTRWLERAVLKRHLRGLASGGVYQAICITTNTGGLLHHRFTLTHLHVRSIFCGTNPADFSGWALPTTLLCEVRTFLGPLRN